MALFDGLRDIAMSSDGDMLVQNNDLKSVYGIDWFIQEVNKIIKSSSDWYYAPNAGVDVAMFAGEPNTRAVGNMIENRIKEKISRQNLQFPADLKVKVVPINQSNINIYINLEYAGENISISKVVLDLQNGFIKDSQVIETEQVKRSVIRNPYAGRLA